MNEHSHNDGKLFLQKRRTSAPRRAVGTDIRRVGTVTKQPPAAASARRVDEGAARRHGEALPRGVDDERDGDAERAEEDGAQVAVEWDACAARG